MTRTHAVAGLTLLLGGLLAVACSDSVAPEPTSDGPAVNVNGIAPVVSVPVDGNVRGTLEPGVKIKTHPNRPVDVVSALIRLDGDGDTMVNGASAPTHVRWHTHPGPTIVVVTGAPGAALSLYHAGSCAKHVYNTGDAFVAPDGIHSAWNESGADIVLRATLLLPVGAQPTILEPDSFTDCGLP